ncbi:hypothetical protein TrispH2_000836 [Trichoplax sp. H2]|nr:hypothetical protein TrispH2_000836 [Trichoplax sp. H2]|eukprot:RDD47628.1 hypothetical protein TrispH2_000836 [Trichoplax sp. H2]
MRIASKVRSPHFFQRGNSRNGIDITMTKALVILLFLVIGVRFPLSNARNITYSEDFVEEDVIKMFENSDASEVISELEEDNILDTAEDDEMDNDDDNTQGNEEESDNDDGDNSEDVEEDNSESSPNKGDLDEKSSTQELFARGGPPHRPPHRPPYRPPRPPHHRPWRHPCCKQRHALRCKIRKLRKQTRHLRKLIARLDRKIIWIIKECARRFRPNKRKISFCIRYRLKKHFHSSCHCHCGKY